MPKKKQGKRIRAEELAFRVADAQRKEISLIADEIANNCDNLGDTALMAEFVRLRDQVHKQWDQTQNPKITVDVRPASL